MAHIRKGDTVVVTKGKEVGKRGTVKRIDVHKGRVEIEKVNMIKRHTKPTQNSPQGGIVDKEGTVAISNVALWCGQCNTGVRTGVQMAEDGQKVRVCKKCGTEFVAAAA